MYMKLKSLCGSFWLKEFVLTLAKESTEKKVKGIPVLSEEIHISQLPEYPEYPEYEEIDTQNKVLYQGKVLYKGKILKFEGFKNMNTGEIENAYPVLEWSKNK